MEKKGLGKGLDALFIESDDEVSGDVRELEIEKIYPDPDQHRKIFREDTIKELADSIAVHGIIQPLIVRKDGTQYKIVAGERRYRASVMAGLKMLPVIIRDDISDRDAAEIALIENLQREDLNPVDEAMGYEKLIKDFGITQEEAAERVGKSRSAVTNSLRLLKLPTQVISALRDGDISAGHARALAGLKNENDIIELLSRIIAEALSVRETENEVRWLLDTQFEVETLTPPTPKADKPFSITDEYIASVERLATERIMRRVKIKTRPGKPSGKLVVEYKSSEDLEVLLTTLCGEDFIEQLDK